ncbi:MAG: hypothetical protein ACJAYB_002568 [Psychromonas sp.]|jgi:hypothetical protein
MVIGAIYSSKRVIRGSYPNYRKIQIAASSNDLGIYIISYFSALPTDK